MAEPEQRLSFSETGATLVESMVAFVIMAGTALAIFPIFITAKKNTKTGDVKQLCQTLVRGKLDEYRFGKMADLNAAANATGDYVGLPAAPGLKNLTLPTLSDTSVNTSGTLAAGGGFTYAKLRYNRYFPYSCVGTSAATLLTSLPPGNALRTAYYGMRECVGTNQAWDEMNPASGMNTITPTPSCTSDADKRAQTEIPGFKLYVKLELSTPWVLNPTGAAPPTGSSVPKLDSGDSLGWDNVFSNTCPNSGATLLPPYHDFDGAGDAIRVTVTGIMDFPSVSSTIKELGGISKTNVTSLQCSASATVAPMRYPVRYYLRKSDGMIFSVHGRGTNGDDLRPVFKTLRSDPLISNPDGAIKSIAVHPRNLSIWVLKSAELIRYSNCGWIPVDCKPNGGISDSGDARGYSGGPQIYDLSGTTAIDSIGIDFRSGKVYGFSKQGNIHSITLVGGAALGTLKTTISTPVTVTLEDNPPFLWPNPALSQGGTLPSLVSNFISPEGDEAYNIFLSNDSTGGLSSEGNSSVIFRAGDSSREYQVMVLPDGGTGISASQ